MNTRIQAEIIRDDALAARGLPEIAYRYEAGVGVVAIQRGINGYVVPTNMPDGLSDAGQEQWADSINARIGVTSAQAEAMFVGSAFGWHVPLADPKMHGA